MSRNGAIDWGCSELLAFGSLLVEGTPVRLAGQDSRRGTFVQRHSVLHDRVNGQEWIPLTNLSDKQGKFWVYDSLLSEYAALAFEYGYSVERADALVLWEAQFGDFVNGAQSVLDEFISSAEQKWGQLSSVVLLLPHGYEGQGPDHSSARIERYLQMCAQDNMTVARPSTPASYFHLLRRQAYARPRRPLVVFTPKAMLRLRGATSPVDDFLTGKFEPVLDDDRGLDRPAVKRVLLHAGKIHWDLRAELDKNPNTEIALVRLEQYYPAPIQELNAVLDSYPNAELFWVQDEPENQGAWPFIALEVVKHLHGRTIRRISRASAASTATGSPKVHALEQAAILKKALTV
jgi:2-oxoglutarate decarboxylase